MSKEFLNVLQEFVIFVMAACTHLGLFCNNETVFVTKAVPHA